MSARGVYGLQLAGVSGVDQRLVEVADGAPLLTVDTTVGTPGTHPSEVSESHADLKLLGGGRLVVDSVGRASYTLARRLSAEDLVHPYLAPAASLIQQWRGNEVLHGGAFAVDGRAVVVLGGREDGKSSTLAWLAAEAGVDVLSDDLVVLDQGRVMAGPRCIDLRPQTSAHYAGRWAGQLVRSGDRVRLSLPQAAASAELAAVIRLAWGPRAAVPVPPADRMRALLEQRMFGVLRGDPTAIVAAAALPWWTVSRPRRLTSLPGAAASLLDLPA